MEKPTETREVPVVPPGHDQQGRTFNNGLFLVGVLVLGFIFCGSGMGAVLWNRVVTSFDVSKGVKCTYLVTVNMWRDSNRNGQWDADERSFDEGRIYILNVANDPYPSEGFTGNLGGITNLTLSDTCLVTQRKISTLPPEGFQVTTDLQYTYRAWGDVEIYFGFDDTIVVPTP